MEQFFNRMILYNVTLSIGTLVEQTKPKVVEQQVFEYL